MSQNDPNFENLSFEEALAQLERIVRSLDAGQSTLEKSLQDYEQGVKLLRHCHTALQNAERRIEILKGVSPDGTPVTEIADENRFVTDASQPGQRRGRSTQKAASSDDETLREEKPARKKRVRKSRPENDVEIDNDELNDVPFDFD